METSKAKYGVFIGRFQPFHLGHAAVIDEIIADGLRPVVILGSCGSKDLERNPMDMYDRRDLLQDIYGRYTCGARMHIEFAYDNFESWEAWWEAIVNKLFREDIDDDECVLYVNDKPQDVIPEIGIDGVTYVNMQWWEAIAVHYGVKVKHQTYATLRGINVNATDIRRDLEANRHWLHGHTYRYLKQLKEAKDENANAVIT